MEKAEHFWDLEGYKTFGENGTIWQGKLNMKRIFKEKKILWGAVPPPTTATPTEMTKKRLLWAAVPQPTTAAPAEGGKKKGLLRIAVTPPTTATSMENINIEKRLNRGPVPPSTTATPKEKKIKRLLWGAVTQPSTATPANNAMKKGIVRIDAEIVFPKHSKLESRPVPPYYYETKDS